MLARRSGSSSQSTLLVWYQVRWTVTFTFWLQRCTIYASFNSIKHKKKTNPSHGASGSSPEYARILSFSILLNLNTFMTCKFRNMCNDIIYLCPLEGSRGELNWIKVKRLSSLLLGDSFLKEKRKPITIILLEAFLLFNFIHVSPLQSLYHDLPPFVLDLPRAIRARAGLHDFQCRCKSSRLTTLDRGFKILFYRIPVHIARKACNERAIMLLRSVGDTFSAQGDRYHCPNIFSKTGCHQ